MADAGNFEKTGVMKRCFRCKVFKDASDFQRYARGRDGLRPYCRPCKRAIRHQKHTILQFGYEQRPAEL